MHTAEYTFLPVFFASLLHLVLFIALFGLASFGAGDYLATSDTSLSSISIKARAVNLPEPAPPAPAPQPQAPAEKPTLAPQDAAKPKLEEQDKKPEPQQSVPSEEAAPAEEAAPESPVQETENAEELSASERSAVLAYYGRNKNLVERNFNTGTAAQRELFAGLSVRLKLYLDKSGKLQDVEIIRESGNELFDAEALRAVRRIDRFIVPNDLALRSRYFRELNLEFKLD